jgi:hypothetical protein
MYIIKIVKSQKQYNLFIFNGLVTEVIVQRNFDDIYEMNFYLQTTQKKLKFKDALLIIHDKINNSVDLKSVEGDIFLDEK